jgi:hypothetical protein
LLFTLVFPLSTFDLLGSKRKKERKKLHGDKSILEAPFLLAVADIISLL